MEEILESYDDFVNEARSDSSKIAKKSGTNKQTVNKIQDALNNLTNEDVAKAISNQIGEDSKLVEKVLKAMGKVYAGDLQIRIQQ